MTIAAAGRPRLVVCDVDGTLVRHDKSLSDVNVAAIGRLRQEGIGFALISARPPSGLRWIAERLGLPIAIGAFNGGTLIDAAGRTHVAERLPPDAARTALAMIDAAGADPWLFADDRWFARDDRNPHVPREQLSTCLSPEPRAGFDDLLDRVDKIVAVSDDHAALAALEAEVATALGRDATVARSQPYYLDVTAPAANKGAGVRAIAAMLCVPLAQVIAFGDQRNDLPMFAVAGRSVAMGQSPIEVRAAATHVAATNDDDGVADAIARFVLNG